MNCHQASTQVSIREVLAYFSMFPTKENKHSAFYYAIDREEKTPSLSVNFMKNTAFDFGTGKKYDVVSLVQGIKQCSISEALQFLSQFDFSFQKQDFIEEKTYRISTISEVKHPALITYLRSRNIFDDYSLIKEINYQIDNRKYFGIGFKNDAGGYEIRNRYSKICIGKKEISTIKNGCDILRIFEGFMDFLSFRNLEKYLEKPVSDYVILNSVSMIFKLEKIIENYGKIELYLDNDEAGNRATEKLKIQNPKVEDCRLYIKIIKI